MNYLHYKLYVFETFVIIFILNQQIRESRFAHSYENYFFPLNVCYCMYRDEYM